MKEPGKYRPSISLVIKEQCQNNFPICSAVENGTAGRAGGFVRDDKPDFGEVIWDPFLRPLALACCSTLFSGRRGNAVGFHKGFHFALLGFTQLAAALGVPAFSMSGT